MRMRVWVCVCLYELSVYLRRVARAPRSICAKTHNANKSNWNGMDENMKEKANARGGGEGSEENERKNECVKE